VIYVGKGIATATFESSNLWLRFAAWIIYDGVGTLFPVIMIAFCYHKMQKSLKTSFTYSPHISRNKANATRIRWYIAIPIICFVPFVFLHLTNVILYNQYPFVLILFLATLRRTWGFLNLFAYWFFKPEKQGGNEKLLHQPRSDQSYNSPRKIAQLC